MQSFGIGWATSAEFVNKRFDPFRRDPFRRFGQRHFLRKKQIMDKICILSVIAQIDACCSSVAGFRGYISLKF